MKDSDKAHFCPLRGMMLQPAVCGKVQSNHRKQCMAVGWPRDWCAHLDENRCLEAFRTPPQRLIKLICAWCQTTLRDGTELASHGICEPCKVKLIKNTKKGAAHA